MIRSTANFCKAILPPKMYSKVVYFVKDKVLGWHNRYYSEFGEDIVINCLLSYKRNGFYVDVGCFHPKDLSTTYYLYKNQGWSGIVIDANPQTIKRFENERPRDIAINTGVGKEKGKLEYHMFENASHNTFSQEVVEGHKKGGVNTINTLSIEVNTLEDILDANLNGKEIDYLNIDVEGLDMEVLKSNNWSKYKPQIISVEDINFDIETPKESEMHRYLLEQGYKLKSWNYITLIYERTN